jgi:UDPglucose--hexose-1-phosphate uridylyltransferase
VIGDPAYNVVVQTAPRDTTEPYLWWVDIVPRVGVPAGFELGTGIGVNGVAPEAAATVLRDA